MQPGSVLSVCHLGATLLATLVLVTAAMPSAGRAQVIAVADDSGPGWSELTPAQRSALRPLERDWARMEADNKEKWIDVAGRMPAMRAADRERVQARMAEWARMSPEQRGQARLGFQEAQQASPRDRQAQWEAYQALPPEQKRQLQSRAVPPPPGAAGPSTRRSDRAETKSNIVPNPAHADPLRPVAPSVLQAQPGATTTLITKRPVPPAHQQTGLPKIAGSPEFVDQATLLPQRGPQGAAARSSAASAPRKRP